MRAWLVAAFVTMTVPQEWHELRGVEDVSIKRRDVGGLAECVAVGIVDAPPAVAKAAIDDIGARTGKMPYIKEERVIRRDARGMLVYTRTAAPIVADRDYTLRITDASYRDREGNMVYVSRYSIANDKGPPPRPSVVRVEHTSGEWRFEGIDGGARTRATYRIKADPIAGVPRFVEDWATRDMIGKIFGALRERVRDPIYRR